MKNRRFVGKSILRFDAFEKVTGATKYTQDIQLPHLLYGKIKRSPYPHARIVKIDLSGAKAIPGVEAVITAADLPSIRHGYGVFDEYFLARDKVHYVGDPVAAVASKTMVIAERAVDAIEVEYEELPAVFDPEVAMEPNPDVVIHEDFSEYESHYENAEIDVSRPNVLGYSRIVTGNVNKAFREADLIIKNRYELPMQQQCPMEPHNAVVRIEPDGSVTIWRDTQKPYLLRNQICRIFGLPTSKVRVIVQPVGGAFGNKTDPKMEGIAVALAKKTGKPVRISFTREEVFSCTSVRHPCIIYIQDGAKKNGKIIARKMKLIWNAGAYCEESIAVSRAGALGAIGTYKIPNFELDNYCVYTNSPIGGAFRGFGSPQVQFAIEQQMDIIAERLNIDSIELHMTNALEEGDENVIGEVVHSLGAKECLREVGKKLMVGKSQRKGKSSWIRGKGIALGNKYSVASPSTAIVKVYPPPWLGQGDIAIEVRTSAVEIGQGAHTVMTQIAAEEFDISPDNVTVVGPDTSLTPFDMGTVSSRITFNMGNAVRLACQDAKRQLFELAISKLEENPENLLTRNGEIQIKDNPKRSVKIKDLFTPYLPIGFYVDGKAEIIGKGTFRVAVRGIDVKTGKADFPWRKMEPGIASFYTHTAVGAEVEVNVETGEVRILQLIEAVDVGKAINYIGVEEQIRGGIVMAVSCTLFEKMALKNGKVVNADFTDYKLAAAKDLPSSQMIQSIILENAPHKKGPYGAKGLGEAVTCPVAPAIANAIYDAIKIRVKELPITPEKVLQKINTYKNGKKH